MRSLLSFLASHMTAVLLILGVAVILVIVYLVVVLRRARRKQDGKDGEEAGTEAPAPLAAVTAAADLELSFRRALKALRSSTNGPAHRYRIPWYLTLGPSGSGKTSLLEGAQLPRRVQPSASVASSLQACQWHFFDDGVVLDVSGNLVLKKDLSSDEVGWRRLLSLLKRYRSERPVDGVILTLSAADLLSWENKPSDELKAIGAGLFRNLRQAQAELGVRFPVYVVLTKADRLPGFSSFVRAVPRRFHQDIFGWSSPYALDSAFRGEWVEEALSEVGRWLRDRSTEVLASRNLVPDADAVFRFPDVATRLVPAARTILSEIFEESAYHEGFFLRGIYFTGRMEASQDATAAPTAASEEPDTPADEEERQPPEFVFLGRLFQRKIFPERGLARGFARGILDRNRAIRWLQIVAAAVVVIGIPGMWWGQTRLQRKAVPLEQLLDSVGNNLAIMTAPVSAASSSGSGQLTQMGREDVVFALLQEMARLDAGPFWSVFLPSSWFSGLDGQITQNLTVGFQDVILPTMRRGIIEWADTLDDEGWATTIGNRVPLVDTTQTVHSSQRFQEYEVLIRYLSEVRQFIDNAGRFNEIASHGNAPMELFSQLFVWYYEQELPPEFFHNDAFYRKALSNSSEQPVAASDWPGFEDSSAKVETFLLNRFYSRLAEAVNGLQQSFAGSVDPSSFTADDLRQLWQDVGRVQDLLTSSDSAWFDSEAPMAHELQVMLDSLPANSDLFSKTEFVNRFTRGFDDVRRRQLAALSHNLTVLSQAFVPLSDSTGRASSGAAGPQGGTHLDLAPQLGTLRAALGNLLNQGFMTPLATVKTPVRPALAGKPTWSLGPLDQALDYFTEYQSFHDNALKGIPPELRGLVTGVADHALENHVRTSLAQAMTYETGVAPEGRSGMEKDVRDRLASFDQAARRLVSMLEMDAKLGGTPAGQAVAETVILESSDILNQVDELLDQDDLYEPINGSLAVWQGNGPASWAGFGVPDNEALEKYLAQQRETLRTLSQYAAPVLGYLSLQPVADLLRSDGPDLVPTTGALVRKWRGIIQTLDDYDKKTPGNSLGALDQFVRQDMAIGSLSGCAGVPRADSVPPRDYFDGVRVRLADMLTNRCRQLARISLLRGYDRMQQFFSTRLAGKFPFVDLTVSPNAPDADTATVHAFLQMYDSVTAPVSGNVADVVQTLLGRELPADFFRQMAEVRSFLGPILTPTADGAPGALEFRTELRTNRAAERGADQIVNWSLTVGGDSATYRGGGPTKPARWLPGEPVSMRLTWASGSQRRPVGDPSRSDMVVDSTSVTWRYGGPWALLRLVGAHRPRAADLSGSPVEDRSTVNLRVLTRSRNATKEPQDIRDATASVFLHLAFAKSPAGSALVYPRFPTRAQPPMDR